MAVNDHESWHYHNGTMQDQICMLGITKTSLVIWLALWRNVLLSTGKSLQYRTLIELNPVVMPSEEQENAKAIELNVLRKAQINHSSIPPDETMAKLMGLMSLLNKGFPSAFHDATCLAWQPSWGTRVSSEAPWFSRSHWLTLLSANMSSPI